VADKIDPARRSANMRAIRSRNMKPEMIVRKLVYCMGYRYRLHRPDLPGKPDLVFSSRKKIIFVHGCFWHSHECGMAHKPKSNLDYWVSKLARNKERDTENIEKLEMRSWQVCIVWECETKNDETLKQKLLYFLA
jgi:DNA mismatch endonuclease (patch repair protein)